MKLILGFALAGVVLTILVISMAVKGTYAYLRDALLKARRGSRSDLPCDPLRRYRGRDENSV